MLPAASAFMTSSSVGGNENGAALEHTSMGGLEHLIDFAERVFFDERRHPDAPVQDQLKRFRIEFRRTAPVADRAGVIGHEIGKSNLDLIHGESDHTQSRARIEQAERNFLPGAGAGAFENDPFGLPEP